MYRCVNTCMSLRKDVKRCTPSLLLVCEKFRMIYFSLLCFFKPQECIHKCIIFKNHKRKEHFPNLKNFEAVVAFGFGTSQ